jgi:hypothetical protein
MIDQIYKAKLMALISENLAHGPLRDATARVRRLFDEIRALPVKTPFLERVLIDMIHPEHNHGQVERAFQPEFFQKWGNHWLRSLLRFHAVEQCGNFKDQSLQLYATPQFTAMQTMANRLFINLPPPHPLRSSFSSISSNQAPISMSRMYAPAGVCFAGECWVELKNGRKMVRDLRKGDRLFDGGVVECVVEMIVPPGEISELCVIGRAVLTPYHPIELEGEWVFPCSMAPIVRSCIPSWFNLVVQGNKVARVEGVKAITLAHGMTRGVLAHPYFGTDAVVDALKKYPGYAEGYVRPVRPDKVMRNAEGMIISLF